MEKKNEESAAPARLENLPVRSDAEGFQPAQMIACPQCARKNAPTRLKCLYCGVALPVTAMTAVKQISRKLEDWEKGFNLILLPSSENSVAPNLDEIAAVLRLEKDDLRKILDAGKILPLACAESATEAQIIADGLSEKGLAAAVLSDEKMALEKSARRLRGIEFFADKIVLKLFNADETVEIMREDLVLIVTGALFERKIESTHKHLRKKESKVLDTTELSSDESLIDLYSRNDAFGCRIESNGFDFSGLGDDKQLFAAQNMKKLAERLRAFAPEAEFDESYNRLRAELSCVWTTEEKKDSKGFVKKGFGRRNLESVTTISNLKQFTRYSRMRRNLL